MRAERAPPGPRVTFLFVRGAHHVRHAILPAIELSILRPDVDVALVTTRGPSAQAVSRFLALRPDHRCRVVDVSPPKVAPSLLTRAGEPNAAPFFSYLAARGLLDSSEVVVSTSIDTPMILRRLRVRRPLAVYHAHGVGDGAYGFGPQLAEFDAMLAGGRQNAERAVALGRLPAADVFTVGYPKLDACRLEVGAYVPPFPEPRPVVWYAPHWNAKLSSLPSAGERILCHFAASDRYNLIYGPHLLVAERCGRQGYTPKEELVRGLDHVLVDLESERLSNMSYASAADVYLGDVSSQVYEFVALRPRPCVFVHSAAQRYEGNPDFAHYALGIVVEDPSGLESAIEEARASHGRFAELQADRVAQYFDASGEPAAHRAARAIEEVLRRRLAGARPRR